MYSQRWRNLVLTVRQWSSDDLDGYWMATGPNTGKFGFHKLHIWGLWAPDPHRLFENNVHTYNRKDDTPSKVFQKRREGLSLTWELKMGSTLPPELWLKIFSLLSPRDLAAVASVCRWFFSTHLSVKKINNFFQKGMERGGSDAPPVEQGEGKQEEADQGWIPPGQKHKFSCVPNFWVVF